MFKKLLSVVLVSVVALSLVACSQPAPTVSYDYAMTQDTDGENIPNTTPEKKTTNTTNNNKKGEIYPDSYFKDYYFVYSEDDVLHITDEEIPGKTLKVNAGRLLLGQITEVLDEPIEWKGVRDDYGSKKINMWRTKMLNVDGDTARFIYKEPINCSKLSELKGFPAYAYINKFNKIILDKKIYITKADRMFGGFSADVENIENLITKSAHDMFGDDSSGTYIGGSTKDYHAIEDYGTFSGNIDLSKLNTSNIVDMSSMFSSWRGGEFGINNLNIGNWDVSNVTNMSNMFSYSSIQTLDIGNWNVSNVTDMSEMFEQSGIRNLDINGWKVNNVTNMFDMFSNNSNLESLNISNWKVSNATNMSKMFSSCSNLRNLNISDWKVNKDTDVTGMFDYCDESIIPEWYKERQ